MNRLEVTLQDIFWALKKHLIWIVLVSIIGAVASFIYTNFFVTPIYAAKVSMVVFAAQRENVTELSSGQLTADATIAETYQIIIESQKMRQAVSDAMGGRVTAGQLSGMISAEVEGKSQVIYVYITSADKNLAMDVGNTLLEVAPGILQECVQGGDAVPLDQATGAPQVSPHLGNNILYGFLISLLLSCAVVVLIAVLDTTIWRESDLERAFDIPVLGSVPGMTPAHGNTHRKGK